jgi:hypothetical protein
VMQVHATCPAKEQIPVGTQGQILDGSGQPIKDGAVTVKQSQPGKLVGESKLAKPVNETTLRFTLFN